MCKTVYFVLLFAVKLVLTSGQFCDYVNNFDLQYKDTDTLDLDWNSTKVSGCISDKTFNPKRVTFVRYRCVERALVKIEKDFINNMMDLRDIKIGKCYIDTIEPGAFSNLPKLEKIEIAFNTFRTVPSGVFNTLPSLQTLLLLDSNISHIEDDAFSNLPNLKGIYVDRCQLDHIRREWFTNTSNIEHFSVYRNAIRKVPAGMFHGWRKLKKLNLNSNAISEIEGVIFKNNSPLIRNLDLHHNRLTSLSPELLPDSVFIEHFSVSANLLNFIPEELLKKIRAANVVIFSNPFSCPCLDKITEILLENDITIDNTFFAYVSACKRKDIPVCGFPSNSSNTCVEAVDKEMTENIIGKMKKARYDVVRDPFGQQCAMFDVVD